jgi:hypothetical protein
MSKSSGKLNGRDRQPSFYSAFTCPPRKHALCMLPMFDEHRHTHLSISTNVRSC